MLAAAPTVGIYMPLYDSLRDSLQPSLGAATPLVAGATARTVAVFCVAPLEVLRTRLMASTGRPSLGMVREASGTCLCVAEVPQPRPAPAAAMWLRGLPATVRRLHPAPFNYPHAAKSVQEHHFAFLCLLQTTEGGIMPTVHTYCFSVFYLPSALSTTTSLCNVNTYCAPLHLMFSFHAAPERYPVHDDILDNNRGHQRPDTREIQKHREELSAGQLSQPHN